MTDRMDDNFSLDELLHPANAFGHPSEVINDQDLTLNVKSVRFSHRGHRTPVL